MYSKVLGDLNMKTTDFKIIRQVKKPKTIDDIFTNKEYARLSRALKQVIWENYEEIIKSIQFTDEELQRLKVVKARRVYENHYERFD